MGIGFVLFLMATFSMGVAFVGSGILGLLTRRLLKASPPVYRRRGVIAAVALPPLMVLAGVAGFLVYIYWCETARDVDGGIGDLAHVPLGSGYSLRIADTTTSVTSASGDRVGGKLSRLGYDDRFIYFEEKTGTLTLIDKLNGNVESGLDLAKVDTRVRAAGMPAAVLQPPMSVYSHIRWGIEDVEFGVAMTLMLMIMPIGVVLYVLKLRRKRA